MKSKIAVDRRTKRQTLTITSRKGETLNLAQATWAASLGLYCVLPPAYHVSSETGVVTLSYALDNMISVKDYVRKYQVTRQDLATWMCDLAQAYGRCTDGGEGRYWQRSLHFDSEYVFVDTTRHLRVVFVPLDGVPFKLDSSPLTLLALLSDVQRVTYATADDQAYAARIAAYVLGEQGTFSFNTFRALVQELCGVQVTPGGELQAVQAKQAQSATSKRQVVRGPKVDDPMARMNVARAARAGGQGRAGGGQGRPATKPQAGTTSRGGGSVPATGPATGGASATARQYVLRRLKTGTAYRLREGQKLVLGRGKDCNLRLEGDNNISRHHASVVVQAGQAKVADLGSSNGTLVNSQRLAPKTAVRAPLPCRFSLGTEEFVVE